MKYSYSDIAKYNFDLLCSLGKGRGVTAAVRFIDFTLPAANVETDLSGVQVTGTPLFTLPSAAEKLKVSSSSADDAAEGTGVRTVQIVGLDANYEPIVETVTLDGQTPVETTGEFLRVSHMRGLTCGTGGVNAGDIHAFLTSEETVTDGVPQTQAKRQMMIATGKGQASSLVCSVPAGTSAITRRISASMVGGAAKELILRVYSRAKHATASTPWLLQFTHTLTGSGSSSAAVEFDLLNALDEKTDIRVTAQADYTGEVFVRYENYVVDNDVLNA